MTSARVGPLLCLLVWGCERERPEVPTPSERVAHASADATAPTEVSSLRASAAPESERAHEPTATASALDALEPAAPASRCALPLQRPKRFSARFLRHVVPHGAPTRWEGVELHGEGTPCPADPAAHVAAPCTLVSAAKLDLLYRKIRDEQFCGLRELRPSPGGSPHYGFRSITLWVAGQQHEVSDSSQAQLDPESNKRFYAIVQAIDEARSP